MTEAVAIAVLLAFVGNVAAQGRFPRIAMGWCPVGRAGVVAGTARGSAGEVGSTSLDRSQGDPPPYRGRAVGRHDETRPTANSARSSSGSTGARSVDTEENTR